jgi:hypothetical protein
VQTFVFAGLFNEGKHIEGTLAEDVVATKTGDAFHPFVPDDITTIAVECEYALDAGVKKLGKKQVALWGFVAQNLS